MGNAEYTAELARQIRDWQLNLEWCDREQEAIDERQKRITDTRTEAEAELKKLTEKTDAEPQL